ncbi:uncharacterized protein LOC129806036 [Phlebotomus papatasi]|uniref:uncharacterized protein LOC129806036 n=1 Tax=Phlebotomus papatasi TaxID=29031 RepID=UPI00248410CA|nr:uncharacterized protein LOC129806036 [Phlebotomus papatasi]
MNIIPELFVSLMFYTCGAWMALNTFTLGEIYDTVILWPEFVGIISACLVAMVLYAARVIKKKIVFLHFYLLACGATLLVVCGVFCVISDQNPTVALYLGAIGHGAIYIAGLCYIHFRASSRRAFRISLCHFVYIVGYTTTVHGIFIYDELIYTVGNFILYSAVSAVALFLINELLHGLGVYDYKRCLDSELHLANEKKDGFHSALDPQTPNGPADSNYWATKLNVEPIVFTPPKKRRTPQQNVLTLGFVLGKIKNAMVFLWVLSTFAILTTAYIGNGLEFVYLYFLLGGVIFGCVISLTVNAKHLYIVFTLGFSICLLTASSLFSVENYDQSAVFFWLSFFFLGFGYFTLDIGILDVTNLQFTEVSLAGGYFIQYFLIALTKFGHWTYGDELLNAKTLLWSYTGSFIGVSMILLIVIAVLYPKTLNLSLLDIQYAILYDEDRWKAKNHEILAVRSPSPVNTQPNPSLEPNAPTDDRPAFMRAQSLGEGPPKRMSEGRDSSMFHHPWYPQHPPNAPLHTANSQSANGLDNPTFDYGSVKSRQIVPRVNKPNL